MTDEPARAEHGPEHEPGTCLFCDQNRVADIAAAQRYAEYRARPSGLLREARRTDIKDDGSPLEWSDLSDALDAVDDVMLSRGHRLSSYSNEEYAAELRKHLAATEPGLDVSLLRRALSDHEHDQAGLLRLRRDHLNLAPYCAEYIAAEYARLSGREP